MGYLYSQNGGLLCDICGGPGARKQRCPFGWCQPIAACAECREKHAAEFGKAAHRVRGCEREHLRYEAQRAEGAAAVAAGEYLLVSALNAGNGMVHAIFRGATGEKGKLIPHALYEQRVNFIECMTMGKFEQLAGGTLQDAPASFYEVMAH